MKLLFLTSRFPFPLEKGDKLRAYHLIRTLSRHADIYLFAISDHQPAAESIAALEPYCKAICYSQISKAASAASLIKGTFSDVPYQVAYFYSESAEKDLKQFVDEVKPDAVFCHLIRMSEYAMKLNIHPSMIDYMDTYSEGMKRYGDAMSAIVKPLVRVEQRRVAAYEKKVFDRFDHKIIISSQDRDWLPHDERNKVSVIPNGVDFSYYRPGIAEKKHDLVFLGNMAYPPNIRAVQFIVKQILPELNKIRPGVTMLIAGATPVPEVKNLESPFVSVSGWVEDPLATLNESRILIAPMLISIGLQNKILQAMAMKIPCVISPAANNAIGAPVEECVLTANTPAEYAKQINRLLSDENLRQRLTENAYNFVRKHFDWEQSAEEIINKLMVNC